MQEAKIILNSKLTHGNKGVNFVTSFRADQGDCWMHVPFKAQLELLDDDVTALVYATCLLYTSPSPRDVEESRMPSSA